MRKKVLLLNPPGSKLYIRDYYSSLVSKLNYYWPPIDLQIFSGYLFGRHDVRVLDAIVERINHVQAYERIINSDIDTIVFITGAVSWVEDFKFIGEIARSKKIDVVASGDILLYHGEDVMKKYDFLNAISLDFTTPDILTYLEKEKDGKKIPNFIYRSGSTIIKGEKSEASEYSIPIPRHELFPLERYNTPLSRKYPLTGILTDFGCPFTCSFCPYANIKFKNRNINNVLEEMRYIASLGIKELVFRNQTFNVSRQHTLELCSSMIREKFNFSWMAISRVDSVDEDALKNMKDAGCHSLIFGVETQNDKVLEKYNKQITSEDSKRAFKLCRKVGIKPSAYIMVGLPGEDKESILKSINFVKELNAEYVSFSIATPRVGTKFRAEIIKNNLVASDVINGLDSSLSFPVIATDKLTAKDIWDVRNYAIRSFYLNPSFILKKLLGISSLRDLRNIFLEGFYFFRNYFMNIVNKKYCLGAKKYDNNTNAI